jgi:hypothetical protein
MAPFDDTITIRLPAAVLAQVRSRSAQRRTSASTIVRDILERELSAPDPETGPTAFELCRRWIGRIKSKAVPRGAEAREALDRWEPDRRG